MEKCPARNLAPDTAGATAAADSAAAASPRAGSPPDGIEWRKREADKKGEVAARFFPLSASPKKKSHARTSLIMSSNELKVFLTADTGCGPRLSGGPGGVVGLAGRQALFVRRACLAGPSGAATTTPLLLLPLLEQQHASEDEVDAWAVQPPAAGLDQGRAGGMERGVFVCFAPFFFFLAWVCETERARCRARTFGARCFLRAAAARLPYFIHRVRGRSSSSPLQKNNHWPCCVPWPASCGACGAWTRAGAGVRVQGRGRRAHRRRKPMPSLFIHTTHTHHTRNTHTSRRAPVAALGRRGLQTEVRVGGGEVGVWRASLGERRREARGAQRR
jgi:hypothetical protein